MEESLGTLQKGCQAALPSSVGGEVRGSAQPSRPLRRLLQTRGWEHILPPRGGACLALVLETLALALVLQASTVHCSSSCS